MAANLGDILTQFGYDLRAVEHLVSAYCTVQLEQPPKVRLWTLLSERDEVSEQRLAAAEVRLVESFPMVAFDFSTTHLRGRDARHFVPEKAIPVQVAA
jgi:hypothetical protein